MIVASFLVKDLHLDWWRGARHFLQHLVDGDLASNNHGWQWVAGTGTDASPYYRVFNPTRQGRQFDPDGDYVRRWVPELRDVPDRYVHEPWLAPDGVPAGYPEPIVEHAAERQVALARYQQVRVRCLRGTPCSAWPGSSPQLFAGRPVHVTSPQGRFEAGAALLDGRVLEEVFSYGKHLFARLRRRHPARPPGPVRHVHRRHRDAAARAARCGCAGRADGPDGDRRVDRPARPDRLRGADRTRRSTAILARLGPDPLRPRADGRRRAPPHRRAAGRRSARCSWTSPCSPASATSTAPSCCSGTASPRSGPAAASTTRCGAGCGPTWSPSCAPASGSGRIVTTRPEDRSRRRGAVQREDAHYVYRRTGLPCRVCGTEVRTEVMVGPQPLLVPGLPGRLTAGPPTTAATDLRRPRRCACTFAADEACAAFAWSSSPSRWWRRSSPCPGRRPRRPRRSATTSPTRSAARRCRSDRAFAVVGVNGGLSTGPTPACAAQLNWAWGSSGAVPAQPRAQLYLNTANPGELRRPGHHLADRAARRPTARATARTRPACSWQYGWERAQNSVAVVLHAGRPRGAGRQPAVPLHRGGSTSRR